MGEALKEARKALARGEFPVGCVLVYRGRVVARGRREGHVPTAGGNELDHAEMVALRRLVETEAGMEAAAITAFCTMEPCLMCFSALMLHGIGAIVYAYEDAMGGGTACPRERLNPLYRDSRIVVRGGIRRGESLGSVQGLFCRSGPAAIGAPAHLAKYTLKQ
ncbi:MAG: deaminase [Desulfosudis oleivorans]|nr:deaminase [Desulfosudis oleivorans]